MTLAKIRSDIQSFLGMTISTTTRITESETTQWINEAYRTGQSKMADSNINYYQGEIQDRDTTASSGRYALPDNFIKMKRLEIQYNDDEDKKRATPIDINDIWSTLDPDDDPWSQERPYYAIWENDFYIKPIPDETSSTWTTDVGSAMRMWFIERQDDLSDETSVPLLPIDYHHILAYFATANGLRKLRKFNEAKEYDALWRVSLQEMVAENTYKDKTKPMGFTITRGTTHRHGIWRP